MIVSRWVLQTVHGFQKTKRKEKVAVGPGSSDCKAGHKTNSCGESCVRSGGLCALGKGRQNTSVSKWVLYT